MSDLDGLVACAPDRLLCTPSEAGRLLSLSRSKVYELMGSGRLPYVLIDSSRRIAVHSLREFVSQELSRQGFGHADLSYPAASLVEPTARG